jgi:hypothetical protein
MINDPEKLVAQMKESLSDECLVVIKTMLQYFRKNQHWDYFTHETFEDVRYLEDNL